MNAPLFEYFSGSEKGPCLRCFDSGWETLMVGEMRCVRRCPCPAGFRRPGLLHETGIPERFSKCTLASYQELTPEQRLARVVSQEYVEGFDPHGLGLVIYGETGVGKTHLAVSILNELMARHRLKGAFCSVPELLRPPVGPGAGAGKVRVTSKQERERFVAWLESADVLLLDDLGIMPPHRKLAEAINHVLSVRYANMRPVIVTTQFPLFPEREGMLSLRERLGPPLLSRLSQMCRFFRLVGCDMRTLQAHLETRPVGTEQFQQALG